MIKRITIENFFSFGNKTEEILLNADTNMLIGINGSGKSNFIKAIRLLSTGIFGRGGLEKLLMTDWGGFSAVSNFSKKETEQIKLGFEFDKSSINKSTDNKGYQFKSDVFYEITIHKSGSSGYFLSELIKIKGRKTPLLEIKNGKGIIYMDDAGKSWQEYNGVDSKQIPLKTEELVLNQSSYPDNTYPLYSLKTAIEKIIIYDYFDTASNSPIRQLSAYSVEKKLLYNGENLIQVLRNIKKNHTAEYEIIEEQIRRVNPMFRDFYFDLIGAKSLLVLREKHLAKGVLMEHISDGTLRFLLLLAILYNPDRGSLVCIDEPEIGLHPDMINTIAKAIKYAAKNGTQMIIATHSPLLLNAFDLDDIWIFEKNQSNETVVFSKSEEDFKDWEGQFLAGQMWLSGKIGGVRWQ